MGIIDDLKHKAEELGEKAKEGLDGARDKAGDLLDDARDKAGDLVEDVRERLGSDEQDEHADHEGARAPISESDDIGPDSSSTDAVQPGYVTGEDAEDAGDAAADEVAEDVDAGSYESDAQSDELVPDADDDGEDPGAVDPDAAVAPAGASADAPLAPVATDVDPYDEPLSGSIGSELSDGDRESLAGAVDDGTDRDS